MNKTEQLLNFHLTQKNRQENNDFARKELNEMNSRKPYSIVALSENFNQGESDLQTPQDNSITIFNNGSNNTKGIRTFEHPSGEDNQISSRSRIIEDQLLNHGKFHSHSTQLANSIDKSYQDMYGMNIIDKLKKNSLDRKSQDMSMMQDEVKIIFDGKNNIIVDSNYVKQKKKSLDKDFKENKLLLIQAYSKKQKKPEKRALMNWRKMKELFKKSKPVEQITLEQYRLINDWASSEYKVLQKDFMGSSKQINEQNYVLRKTISESFIQVQEVMKSIERALFPSISQHIPVIKADSFIAFTFEIYLYILYFLFLIQNWLVIIFDLNCKQNCYIQHQSTLLFIVLFSSLVECFKNMNKSFTLNGNIIQERNEIIFFYMKGNFFFDFMFIISVVCLYSINVSSSELNILFRVGVLFKLKSYIHHHFLLRSHFEVIQGFHNILRILDLICFFFLFTHIMSSLFFVQARIINQIDENVPTWIYQDNMQFNDWFSLYLESMSRIVSLMIGMKKGNYKSNNFERGFEVFTFLMGLFLFSYFVEKTLSFLKENQKKQSKQRNEINSLISYLCQQKVNESLKLKIISYLKNYHKEEINIIRSEGTHEALQKLSDELKKELMIHTNAEHLKIISFFNNFSQDLKIQLMDIMKEKIYQPGQIIFEDGESENFSIYLINKGKVDLCYDTRRSGSKYSVVKQIQKDSVFGQISFLTGFPRKCHAISKEISSLICISRDEFLNLLKSSREEKDQEIFCQMRDQFLNEEDQSVLELSCYQCGSKNHLSDQCIKTHYYIHRKALLKSISSNYQQINRKKFKRFRIYKKSSLQSRNNVSQMITIFIEKNEEKINFLQEEIQMKRFCNQQSHSNLHNQLRQMGSSEHILPIQNSDDNLDPYQSSESSDSDQKSANSDVSKSNTEVVDTESVTQTDTEIMTIQNIKNNISNNQTQGNSQKKQLQSKKSSSMNNITSSQYLSSPSAVNLKNINSNIQSIGSSENKAIHQTVHFQNSNPGSKLNNTKNNNSHGIVSLNALSSQNQVSDLKNEELDEYLSLNNEQTIGSIFQNFDKNKKNKDNHDQSGNKQRNSFKQGIQKSNNSHAAYNTSTNQRDNKVPNQNGNNQSKPKISVSCNDLDSNQLSTQNLNYIQPTKDKKGSIRHSFSFNNAVNSIGSRKSFTQNDHEVSSSTESNTTELFFDQQLEPLNNLYAQPQLRNSTAGFEQIFIINDLLQQNNQAEEKQRKKSKFDILQEKMINDTDSTPISLIDSIYNVDSHPNIAQHRHSKRKGLLPYSTSLSENMRKIARLYSKGSTSIFQ